MKHNTLFQKSQLAQEKFSSDGRLLALICTAILWLLFCVPLSAEEGFVVNVPHPPLESFSGTFLNVYDLVPQSIYTCSDDAVIVLSLASFTDDLETFGITICSIVKLDSSGNLLWMQYFPFADIPNYIIPDIDWITGLGIDENDAVSFIAGTLSSDGPRYLVSVDSNGDIDSMPLDLGDLEIYDLSEGLRTSSGDFIAIGRVQQNWAPYQKPLAYFRISPDAQVLVSSFIPPDPTMTQNVKIYDAEIEAEGTVLVSCKINTDQYELLRLTMDGALIERIQLENCATPPFLHRSSGSEYTIATYTEGASYAQDHIAHIAWVAEDDITYQAVLEPAFQYGNSMISIDNDVYIVSFVNSMSGTWLSRYNYTDAYELAWSWNDPNILLYIMADQHIHRLLSSSQTGCIYAAGYRGYNLAVAKVLPNGQVPVEDDIAAPPLQKINAYPNPMKEHVMLKIDCASPTEASISLEVYNIKGQLVRDLASSRSGEYVWDGYDNKGRSCSAGIYFIRDSKGIYKHTKVIKIK
ncbi:MAG TPA: T9SS type A sorting domain-containing protein [Thermoclostridium sp.]|nr:T9SS type A sorting domain-containing protein [Thermoclostridium sp.]